jgi:hypothetical protein
MNPEFIKKLREQYQADHPKDQGHCIPKEGNHDNRVASTIGDIHFGDFNFGQEYYTKVDSESSMGLLQQIGALMALFTPAVTFIKDPLNKTGKNTVLVDPSCPDENYPTKCYFNALKKIKSTNEKTKQVTEKEVATTVLVFSDGTKIKLTADANAKDKTAYNGLIIGLAKRILGPRVPINRLYDKFKSDKKTEAMLYGVVMGYFVTNGIVRDAEMFDKWAIAFTATRTLTNQKKK